MQTNRIYAQATAKSQPNRPGPAPSVNHAKPLVLQLTISKGSFKNASVQALSILSPAEVRELVDCEEIIGQGWDTFVAVGRSLAAIRDKRLYRADFDTFETYCRQKWQYGKSHAYRLIGAAEVIASLSPIGDIPLPRNESQVRPLLGLKAEEVQAVWRQVVKDAGKKHITATLVKETADHFRTSAGTQRSNGRALPTHATLKPILQQAEKLLQKAAHSLDAGDIVVALRLLCELRRGLYIPAVRIVLQNSKPRPKQQQS